MSGPEGGPGGGPGQRPLKEREKPDFNLDEFLTQPPMRGGEVVPLDGSRQLDRNSGTSRDIVGPGGAPVATLERPEPQFQTQTETDVAPPPPEIGIKTPEAQAADPLRVVLTSLDQNVDAFAREAAHEELSKKHEGPFWKRIAKSAWHNITREYQVVKATKKAREAIVENENLLHHQGKSDEGWREATIDRYGSEYGEHLIHEGETFHKLSAPEAVRDPKAERIRSDIQDVMRQVARGEVADDESLRMIVDRMTEVWRQENVSQDYIGEGQFLANNIGRKARELEAMINSAEGLSAVDKEAMIEEQLSQLEVVAGEARVGSRTEIDSTLSERLAEKLRNVPFVSESRIAAVAAALGNETVIAAMMSGTIYAAKRGASLAGKIIAPGIGAGVVAAIRERNALMDERALEERRSDAGKAETEVSDDSELGTGRKLLKKVGIGKSAEEYRAELNATQYEARPVGELLDDLSGLYNESGELNIMDRESLDKAMELMGQIRARIQIGDRTGARLISFTDVSAEEMESRRFDLDLAMAKLETDMQKMMEDPIAKAMLDIRPDEKFAELFAAHQNIAEGMIMGEMRARDRLFNKLVRRRALKRAIAATFMGAAIGSAVKYGAEAVREAAHTVRGAFSNLFNGQGESGAPELNLASYNTEIGAPPLDRSGDNPTPGQTGGNPAPSSIGGSGNPAPTAIGGDNPTPGGVGGSNHAPVEIGGGNSAPEVIGGDNAPGSLGGNHAPTSIGGEHAPGTIGGPEQADTGETVPITDTSKVNVPEGYKAEVNSGTGSITITGPDGKEYSGLTVNPDGSFSESTLETLRENGFNVTDSQEVVPGKPEIVRSTVKPPEFVKNHKDSMKLIHHTRWFDNNTSKFDLNELGLDNHVDGSGNVVVDIRGMTAGGSFHGASGVDWQEAAKEGHLKVYLSASKGTQAHAFEVSVRPDGTALINKGSPAAALFDSRGTFVGGFQEVALNGGQASDDGENIATLATVVGKQQEAIRDTIQKPTLQTAHSYTITHSPVAQPTAFTQPVPTGGYPSVIPITTRRRVGEALDREVPALPEAPVAPVIPLRPELQPPASSRPELTTAPQPARSPEAERLAATRGLGSSAATPETSAAIGGAESNASSNNSESANTENFTPDEAILVRQIDGETREFPPQFDSSVLAGLSGRERKLVTRLAYDAMLANPRAVGESPLAYTHRVSRALQDGAVRGRAERLPLMSASLRAVASKAFQALANAKAATPGGGRRAA